MEPALKIAQPSTLGTNVARIVEIDAAIKAKEQEVELLVEERRLIEKELMDQFADAQIQNVKILGRTVYLNRSIYCNVMSENMEAIVAVLDKNGMGDIAPRIATTQKIKGLLKEDEATWKERLGSLISTGEIFSIRSRGA